MASIRQTNQQIVAELQKLLVQDVITEQEYMKIAPNYPPEKWDLIVLFRSFTLIGTVATGIGLVLLIHLYISMYCILEVILALLTMALLLGGYFIRHKKDMLRAGSAMQLLACFTLSALTFTLGLHYSTGLGNWPSLVGIDALLCLILAYTLNNHWVLIYAMINLFIFFGGETGYVSGWGAYWLKIDYPLRYSLIGISCIAIAFAHRYCENDIIIRFRNFNRVYLHFGLLILNLSLWFFALFGLYNGSFPWDSNEGERFLFTLLWGLVSGLSIYSATRINNSTLRSYGLVFLIINIYTAYFQFVAANSAEIFFIHFFIMGGSMIALAFNIEGLRRIAPIEDEPFNADEEQVNL